MFPTSAEEENLLAEASGENPGSAPKPHNLRSLFSPRRAFWKGCWKRSLSPQQHLLEAAADGRDLGIFILGFGTTRNRV